jgi:carboxylate-amine ligase
MDKMNHFNASCWGLNADYIIDNQGHSSPIKAVIQETFQKLAPTALELGTTDYLRHLENHLVNKPSYLRQRRLFQETGSLRTVAAALVKELEEELATS